MTSVLHVLDHSLPEQSGYAFRSHAILRELIALGIEAHALTGPKHGSVAAEIDEIDRVRYHRTAVAQHAALSGVGGQLRTIWLLRRALVCALRDVPVDVVHAHSPCLNGIAALGLGRPFLYEIRSLWEDSAVATGVTTEGSVRYRISRALETLVASRADEIVVICEGLRADLMTRGIRGDKITVVPNALPEEMFERPSPEAVLGVRSRFALTNEPLIGFFGTFFEWEGLHLLIEALPSVIAALPTVKVLLAGGGRDESRLRALVRDRNLEGNVIFAGRVSHEEVRAFYGAVNVVAYPRIAHRLTDLVTPLKPLEAMAQGTPVVASDVGGHRELLRDGETGFLFAAGDATAFAEALLLVLRVPEHAEAVKASARQVVEQERRWSVVARRYLPVYERLGRRAAPEAKTAPETKATGSAGPAS